MRPLGGFPTSHGSSRVSIFPHAGPASYTQVTAGSAPALSTGGDEVAVEEAGLGLFDHLIGGLSDSGTYRVEPVYDAVSGVAGNNNPGVSVPKTTARLRWVVVSTGSQAAGAVDLSAEIVRLYATGPK